MSRSDEVQLTVMLWVLAPIEWRRELPHIAVELFSKSAEPRSEDGSQLCTDSGFRDQVNPFTLPVEIQDSAAGSEFQEFVG